MQFYLPPDIFMEKCMRTVKTGSLAFLSALHFFLTSDENKTCFQSHKLEQLEL